jgi:hypothetical protein
MKREEPPAGGMSEPASAGSGGDTEESDKPSVAPFLIEGEGDPDSEIKVFPGEPTSDPSENPATMRSAEASAGDLLIPGEQLWRLYQEARRDAEAAQVRVGELQREVEILRSQCLNLQAAWQELMEDMDHGRMIRRVFGRKRRW